jgi:predicted metal-binding membrane protein
MTMSSRRSTRINFLILLVSAIAWVMLLVNPGSIISLAHCPVTDSGASMASFQMLLAMNPMSSMAAGWGLMLVAMMSPTLIAPIGHILERSFRRRRARSVALFILGYAVIWMIAGGVLITSKLLMSLLAPQSYLPAAVVGLIAFIWQCSPAKQRCLNRGHNHRELAAFGIAADLDAFRFGITHAIWCVGSCWVLMLFPMLLSDGHFAAMAAVTFIMISERLEPPRPLGWRLCLRGKLMRIVVAQTRIRLHAFR